MFRQTLARLDLLNDVGELVVVANQSHRATIEAQLPDAGPPATLILEPIGRDSGAAIAAAAVLVAERDPDGVALVLPSDHYIPEAEAFGLAARLAIQTAADHGAIVTFGLKPTSPSTAYGYIRPGAAIGEAFRVDTFAEKPDAAAAELYVSAGYLWNSGMFVARASVLVDEFAAFAPEVLAAARAAVADATSEGRVLHLGRVFETAPKISFDYAVMEKTVRAAVVPTAMTWSDLGAWDAVWAAAERDDEGNAKIGDCLTIDTRDCYIQAAGSILVATVGLRNLAIIAMDDALLVCDLDHAQEVKSVVEQLKARGRPEIDFPRAGVGGVASRRSTGLETRAAPLLFTKVGDHRSETFREAPNVSWRPPNGEPCPACGGQDHPGSGPDRAAGEEFDRA